MEVVYSGLRQTPEQIVEAALQEDVEAIGVSILSGAHNHLIGRIMELLEHRGMEEVLVFAGGIIPDQDVAHLKQLGVVEVFPPGSSTDKITDWLRRQLSVPSGDG